MSRLLKRSASLPARHKNGRHDGAGDTGTVRAVVDADQEEYAQEFEDVVVERPQELRCVEPCK